MYKGILSETRNLWYLYLISEINDMNLRRKGLMINDIVRNVGGPDVGESPVECMLKIESKQDNLEITMEVTPTHF